MKETSSIIFVIGAFQIAVFICAFISPAFARGLAKLLITHAAGWQKACAIYAKAWERSDKVAEPPVEVVPENALVRVHQTDYDHDRPDRHIGVAHVLNG